MQIQRKAQVLLDVAKAAMAVPNPQEFARRLGKAALVMDYPEQAGLADTLGFDFDPGTRRLTITLSVSSLASREATDLIAEKVGDEAPAILAFWERLPRLTWGLRVDDVVVLNDEEARALRWVGLAVGQDVK